MLCRSVSQNETSIALGFQTLIARSLGTVPGPIFLGFIIDQTCILWNDVNNGECIAKGSCKLYDNITMSHYVLIVLLIWRSLAFLSISFAMFLAERCPEKATKNNEYRKVASSRPVYYSILELFGQRSHYISFL